MALFVSVFRIFGFVSVEESSLQYSIKSRNLLPPLDSLGSEKNENMDQARSEKEVEIVNEMKTKTCGSKCEHCEHTEACDVELPFRQRFCGGCRVSIFHQMIDWQSEEYEKKSQKIKDEGTQEFMSTGRIFFCDPPSYEFIHINSGKKFSSEHMTLDAAVAEYLADPDRDLPLKERLLKNLKIRCEERAKVFVQVYLGGKQPSADDLTLLKEKYARIDRYSTHEFEVISDTPPYEYIHLNEHAKFRSEHAKISDAIQEYIVCCKKREGGRPPYELDEELVVFL